MHCVSIVSRHAALFLMSISLVGCGGSGGTPAAETGGTGGETILGGSGANPPVAGYVLRFDDEFTSFNGNASGTNGWMTLYSWGGRTNNAPLEAECYMDTSVGENPFSIVSGGGLQISATLASATGSNPCGLPYNSGLIDSSNSFYMQYGYFEMSAKMAPGAGLWPAFWLVPENGSWPPEIDVVEQIGVPTTIYQTIHYVENGTNTSNSNNAITVADTTAGYHVYAVDWEPTTITYYFDGVQTLQLATPSDMNVPMSIIANLAVGAAGSWPGTPNSSTVFPADMVIKYIRAYASPNSAHIGGSLVQ